MYSWLIKSETIGDRDLLQSLAFDANVTEVFTEKKLWKINREDK